MRCACALLISAKCFASLVVIRECSLAVYWQIFNHPPFSLLLAVNREGRSLPLSVFIRFVLQFLVFSVKMSAEG